MNDPLIERMTEIAHRDSAVSVTVRAVDLRALLSKLHAPVADERAAFEADWRGHSDLAKDPLTGAFTHLGTQSRWAGWLARAALASAPVANTDELSLEAQEHGNRRYEQGFAAGWDQCVASAPVAGEAAAWMKDDGSDAWTDKKKRDAVKYAGAPGVKIAESYSVPLFRHAAPQASEAVRDALVPFAALEDADLIGTAFEGKGDDAEILHFHRTGKSVTLGDFRRARAALSAQPGAQKDEPTSE